MPVNSLPCFALRVDFADPWKAFCNFDIFFRHQRFLYLADLERKRVGASHFLLVTLTEAHFLDDLLAYCHCRPCVEAVAVVSLADYDAAPADKVWQLYRPRQRANA